MGVSASGHRRTVSNVSNTSNINQGFHYDQDDDDVDLVNDTIYNMNNFYISNDKNNIKITEPIIPNRIREYENIPSYLKRHNNINIRYPDNYTNEFTNPTNHERPHTLALEHGGLLTPGSSTQMKLRSSLKKQEKLSAGSTSASNPTPPGSLTSDDSSYLSAREGSLSSHSRVRFSPEILLDMPSSSPHLESTNKHTGENFRRTLSTGMSPNSTASSSGRRHNDSSQS